METSVFSTSSSEPPLTHEAADRDGTDTGFRIRVVRGLAEIDVEAALVIATAFGLTVKDFTEKIMLLV
jgi:hypothetical protein